MSKIAKFINSALNNSNANEAAQALKLAASTMQKEGVNPNSFLQHKGAANDSEKLSDLELEYADLEQAYEYLRQKSIRLEHELALAKSSNTLSIELREAKKLTVKWHRIAQEQGNQLSELAPIAVAAQEEANLLKHNIEKQKNRLQSICVISCLAVAAIAYHMGSGSGYDRGFSNGQLAATQPKERKEIKHQQSTEATKPRPLKAETNSANEVINNLVNKPIQKTPAKKTIDNKLHPKSGIYNFVGTCKGDGSNFNVSFKVNLNNLTTDQISKTVYGSYHLIMPGDYGMVSGDKFKLTFDEVGIVRNCTVTKSWE
ncbi:hypothetical protein [Ewingella americana]|uniref:hypothetical protein n=1 Tax=Ewingella americana TaxID=41202 RepID=UPI0012AE3041|nr:hypothetical protein [Ewingella americana]MRT04376.1 hypothetical protein [Ewingella americana]